MNVLYFTFGNRLRDKISNNTHLSLLYLEQLRKQCAADSGILSHLGFEQLGESIRL